MSRSATRAGPGGTPSRSQRRTVRVSTSSSAAACVWFSPSASNRARTSVCVTAADAGDLQIGLPGERRLGMGAGVGLGAAEQHAVCFGAGADLAQADDVDHETLRFNTGIVGHFVRYVQYYFRCVA